MSTVILSDISQKRVGVNPPVDHLEGKNESLVTLSDISLRGVEMTPRVRQLKDDYFRALPEICTERSRLITEFSEDLFEQRNISILDKAKLYRRVLEKRNPIVRHTQGYEQDQKSKDFVKFGFKDTQLFAGSTTGKFKGVPLYPEFLASSLWPELGTISKRATNPYYITPEAIEELNHNIFPRWIYKNILELARERCNMKARQNLGFGKPLPEIAPLKLMERIVYFFGTKVECISHTIPDFSRAIRDGLGEIIKEAEGKERRAKEAKDKGKQEFYAAISEVLQGLITYSNHLADEAERLACSEVDPIAKQELLDIARIHRQVPEHEARTFREGLSTLWICWTAIHLENPNIGLSLGRLDQVLYPLYKKDKNLNINTAIELLCCFCLKIGDHVPMVPEAAEQLFGGNGSNQAITIGGVDKNCEDAVNDLTYMILRAIELMKLRDPNLNARYYSRINPPEYLIRLCEANVNTGATPAIHNDKAVIKSLRQKGDSEDLANDYGIVGCVEPTSCGRTYGACAAIQLNLTSALELTLFNGRHRHTGLDIEIGEKTGDPETFGTFDEFAKAFRMQTEWLVSQATSLNKSFEEIHQDFYPTPILSAFFEGPMDKGIDLIQGGAKINSSGASIIGLADVADSLSAIQKVVYEEKAISLADLLDALEKNFKGYEAFHMRLLNPDKTPKYGNPNGEANAKWIIKMLDDAFEKWKNGRGGGYRVGYWTMTNHAGFGRLMKAFPNGRKDHENFSSGITPVSGVTPYLTQVLNSVAELPAASLSNGVALNLKFTPENEDNAGLAHKLSAYIEAYFDDISEKRDGGMEIQFNIIPHDTFVDAVTHPEKYPELLVRVSGYTAYFKDLNPQMQAEIINRTEYLLSSGTAVLRKPFPLPKTSGKKGEMDLA
jgi:pyruvate formate-lyase/glycerol dehydratase family glycyl radical enzyme